MFAHSAWKESEACRALFFSNSLKNHLLKAALKMENGEIREGKNSPPIPAQLLRAFGAGSLRLPSLRACVVVPARVLLYLSPVHTWLSSLRFFLLV